MHIVNASHLTVRNLPKDVAAALDREKRRRGTSLNQTVVDLLRLSLGVGSIRSNGLRAMAGTWTEAEHQEFLARVQVFETIEADLWK
jgi:plasmid stability protein